MRRKANEELLDLPDLKPPPGMCMYMPSRDTLTTEIHISAAPGVTEEQYLEARASLPTDEARRIYDREVGMNDAIFDGVPVFPEYDVLRHTILTGRIQTNERGFVKNLTPGSYNIIGYDCGLTPAAIFLQVIPEIYQVHAVWEMQAFRANATTFAPLVGNQLRLMPEFINPTHACDPAGFSQDQSTGLSVADVFWSQQHIRMIKGVQAPEIRRNAVSWLLTDMIDERTPRFVIDKNRCPILCEGFEGAYRLREMLVGSGMAGESIYASEPVKNQWSHLQDALQYAAVLIYQYIMEMSDPTDITERRERICGKVNI